MKSYLVQRYMKYFYLQNFNIYSVKYLYYNCNLICYYTFTHLLIL